MHVSSLGLSITIHIARKAWMALLLAKNVSIMAKYSDFAHVFLETSANVLPERTKVNEHRIKLEETKQPPFGPIYSLELVEFRTLKTYIEINLANKFCLALTLPAGPMILFIHKPDISFCFWVDYQGLNNPKSKIGICYR